MPSTNEEFSLPPLNNGLATLGRYKNFFSLPVLAALGLATISLPLGIVSAVFASTAAPRTAIPMIISSFVTTSFGIYELSNAYNLATDTESTLAEKLVGTMRAVRDFSRSSARVHVTDGTLEEILKNANERTIADNCKITNSGAIKDVFESKFSPYRSAAQSFIKALPNNASAQEIITLANSYYHDDSRATEAAKARMNDEERRDFTENKRLFRENLIVMKYGRLGEIDDSKISQAIFLSQVVASIKNPLI